MSQLDHSENHYNNFQHHLQGSKSILALLGAGLSASSGIQTYQGNGSVWKEQPTRELSTRSRFERDPLLVWEYYRHRQSEILVAEPNAGHFALAALASRKCDFLAITQNVDDLSQRAGHPPGSLVAIHGQMLDLCCTNPTCTFRYNHNKDAFESSPQVFTSSPIPTCPLCTSLLRPTIIRFGDQLDPVQLDRIESWFSRHPKIDLMLVIGCSATVSPAADYIDRAKERGARIAVVNVSYENQALQLGESDWFFGGDAGEIVPALIEAAI